MTDPLPLTDRRAEAYRGACQDRGAIAFVAVTPIDKIDGIHGAIGIAIANERGYMPVPLAWARYDTLEAAEDHTERLNREVLKLTDDEATRIVISTMGGMRYNKAAMKDGA